MKKLRDLRIYGDLSRVETANILNVSENKINNVENETSSLTLKQYGVLLKSIFAPLDFIFKKRLEELKTSDILKELEVRILNESRDDELLQVDLVGFRKKLGLSIKDLAKDIRCSPNSLCDIESGKSSIKVSYLEKMIRHYGAELDDLVSNRLQKYSEDALIKEVKRRLDNVREIRPDSV